MKHKETTGICSPISSYECKIMAKLCFLGRKLIQFRPSEWVSEVLASKKKSRKRITQQGIVEEDLLWSWRPSHLQENYCQRLTKSSRLWENAQWFISHKRKVLSMWKRMEFSARCCCNTNCINYEEVFAWTKNKTSWLFSVLSRPKSYRIFLDIDYRQMFIKAVNSTQQFLNSKMQSNLQRKCIWINFRNQLIACFGEFLRLLKLTADLQNVFKILALYSMVLFICLMIFMSNQNLKMKHIF